MDLKNDVWGPDINHYTDDFDLDAAQSTGDTPIANIPGSWEDVNVIPLTTLETILSRPDLKQGYCYGDCPLMALIITLRNYERANPSRIFNYYYGFLCIRCIMHIVCIGMLVETGTLDTLLTSLDQNLGWKQVCSSIAHETMRQIECAIQSESEPGMCARFEAIFSDRKVLSSVGGITASDCTLVLRLLWEDRTSFLTHCERGILPGCPTLLYTFSRVILAHPRTSADIQPRLIQELCVRKYLSSSNREKYALREASWLASQQAPEMKPIDLGEAVLEDNLVFTRAYIRMVSSRDPNNTCFQTFDWNGMGNTLSYIIVAVGRDSATKRNGLVIMEKTVSLLWLILAKKIHQPSNVCPPFDPDGIWEYFAAIFGSMWRIWAYYVRSHEEELRFAKMLAESDVLALAGRVLLLMTEEDPNYHRFTLVRAYPQLCTMFKKSILVAPHLFADSTITWVKVFEQLSLPAQLGSFSMVDSDPKLVRCTVEMIQTWVSLGEPFRPNSLPQPKPCAYSRCFQPFTKGKTLRARYLCGRCGTATYCDPNCQSAHWQLNTVDSHRLECV